MCSVVNGKQYHQQNAKGAKGWYYRLRNTVQEISKWSKLYLFIVVIYVMAQTIQCTSSLIVNATSEKPSYSGYYLNSLMIFISFLMMYFSAEAVVQENEYQLTASLIASFFISSRTVYTLVRTIVNMVKLGKTLSTTVILVNTFTIFVPTFFVLVSQLVMVAIVVPVFRSFGWKLYRMVGVAQDLISKYLTSASQ